MSEQTSIVFLGTPEFSTSFLEQLAQDDRFKILAVITQQDQPQGRKKILTPPPIKLTAQKHHLEIYQPPKLNKDSELLEKLKQLKPDFLLVIAYGQILSNEVLNIPEIKPINVHGSILPKYRGASPIEQSLLNGDTKTGLSIMEMVKEMDAGAVYTVIESPIDEHDTNQTLRNKLATLGSAKLPEILLSIKNNQLLSHPQNEQEATFCHKITRLDGLINPIEQSATEIYNRWRAFNPWPGIFMSIGDKQMKFLNIQISTTNNISSGRFLIDGNRLYLGCKTNSLEILEIQVEGKTPQTVKSFLSGNRHYFENL